MKFSEVLQKMNNMKLGTKIIRDDGQIYQLMKKSGKRKFGRLGNKKGQQRFMTYTNINKNFELLEENDKIKELNDNDIYDFYHLYLKINELVRAVNKLIKESEVK